MKKHIEALASLSLAMSAVLFLVVAAPTRAQELATQAAAVAEPVDVSVTTSEAATPVSGSATASRTGTSGTETEAVAFSGNVAINASVVTDPAGEYLFKSRCSLCHTIGKGDLIGPDLVNVRQRRDPSWLARYVTAPERIHAAGDPIAKALYAKYPTVRMPNLNLSAEEVGLLLPYIEEQSRAATRKPARTKAARSSR